MQYDFKLYIGMSLLQVIIEELPFVNSQNLVNTFG